MAQERTTIHSGEQNQPVMTPAPPHDAAGIPITGRKRKCPLCARCFIRNKKKGDRSFIEGCLFALCCCWLCDVCFDVDVVVG